VATGDEKPRSIINKHLTKRRSVIYCLMKKLPAKGRKVRLLVSSKAYGCGFPTWTGEAFVPKGAVGTVATDRVPSVCRNNVWFCCVDFPHDQPLEDSKGKPFVFENTHKNKIRVGVLVGESEYVEEK
jgi:hypothetical protein